MLVTCCAPDNVTSHDDLRTLDQRIKDAKVVYLGGSKEEICKKTKNILIDLNKYYDWLQQYVNVPPITEENKDNYIMPGSAGYDFPLDLDLNSHEYYEARIKPILGNKPVIGAYVQYGIKLRSEDPNSLKALQYLVLASIPKDALLVSDENGVLGYKILDYKSNGYEFPLCYVVPKCNIDEKLTRNLPSMKECKIFRKSVKDSGLSKVY